MKLGKVLIYFGILVALASYVYFVEIRYKKEQETHKAEAERIAKIEKDKITEVALTAKDAPKVSVRKIDDNWLLTEPIKVKADQKAIQSLLATFEQAQFEKVLKEKDVAWQEYGLEQPEFTVTVKDRDDSVTLYFGESNPAKTSYYMRKKGDDRLLLVADTLKNSLNKSVLQLREKTVLTVAPSQVERVVVAKDGKEIELKREGPEAWIMVKPESFKVKAAEVNRNLVGLTNLQAKDIIDEPRKEGDPYGLDNSDYKILLDSKDRKQTLLIGKALEEKGPAASKPDRYARIDGQDMVYVIGSQELESFKTDPSELRDKSVLSFKPDEIEKAEVQFDGKTWVVQKSGENKWTMEKPEKRASVEAWRITGMLWDLKSLEWKDMSKPAPADLAAVGLDNPRVVISLFKKDSQEPMTLKVGWTEQKADKPQIEPPKAETSGTSGESKQAAKESVHVAPSTPGAVSEKKPEGSGSAPEKGPEPTKPSTELPPEEPKIPRLVNAIVQPHDEQNALLKLDSSFIGRMRKDLMRIGGEEEKK